MKFARLGSIGQEIPVVISGGVTYDLRSVTSDIDGKFLEFNGSDQIRELLERDAIPELPCASAMRVGAPIARPSAVVCIGLNFHSYVQESGRPVPKDPVIFLKTPNTVIGPNDAIAIPRDSFHTDWEVELGVVIKSRASQLDSPVESHKHIAGFVTINDVTERAFQMGKCAPGFCPTGPWLVTPDSVDHRSLAMRSWVNGEPRQDSSSSDMVFDVDYLIWHVSQYLILEPGDLVITGTPAGVADSGRFPFLSSGDLVEIEIEGLGRQRSEFY